MSSAAKRTLLYGVLALCLMGFAWVSGRASGVDSVVLRDAAALVGGHKGYTRVVDSLQGLAQREASRADSLGKHPRYLTVVTAHHDTLTVLDTVWVAQEVTALRGAYTACSEGLTRCRARADSLQASLEAVLKTRECRLILGIPCPSRGALFVLGAVGGALLEHRLSR